VLEQLDKFIKECKVLSKELQLMARSLVANEQGGPLAQLRIAPQRSLQHRTLGAIVVHTAAVLLCQQGVQILQPFLNMLNNPAALVHAYLPTMPEDYLPEARRVLGGTFYGNTMTQCSYVFVFLINSWEPLITDVNFSLLLKSVQEDIHT